MKTDGRADWMTPRSEFIVALCTVVLIVVTLMVITKHDSASAAGYESKVCERKGKALNFNNKRADAYYCHNSGAPIYTRRLGLDGHGQMGGWMDRRPDGNWVICSQVRNDAPSPEAVVNKETRPGSTVWFWTKGDHANVNAVDADQLEFTENEGWGWMPANYVAEGSYGQGDAGVRACTHEDYK